MRQLVKNRQIRRAQAEETTSHGGIETAVACSAGSIDFGEILEGQVRIWTIKPALRPSHAAGMRDI
jgi:hypothetical protein